MTVVVTEADVDADRLEAILACRDGVVLEERDGDSGDGDSAYVAIEGPLERYHRSVIITQLDDGRAHVHQTVDYRLAFPYFRFLFTLPMRSQLGRLDPPAAGRRLPWWHPPDRLDKRAATILAVLGLLSIVIGYLGSILTQTITYASEQFGTGRRAQGIALASVRGDIVISLILVSLADRKGRRPMLLFTAMAGCALTAVGGLSPSLPFLAASQVVARGCVTAAAVIIAILAAEEVPRNARAYAVSILAMAAAFGSGQAVLALPLAGLGENGWRLLFAGALIGLPLVASTASRLPESHRFVEHDPHSGQPRQRANRGRLILLAVSGLLISLFLAPAAQFQNEYLRTERSYSASQISLFTLATNTPGGIGVVVGGRLADVKGRRLVGAVGIVCGVSATAVMYFTSGWTMWAWSIFGAITGAAVVPALAVYGPELFPTAARGSSNGLITAAGRVGSVLGLVLAGFLSSAFGELAPALAILAIGPIILAVLILVAYPETAHLELEQLNPEDALPGQPPVPPPPLHPPLL